MSLNNGATDGKADTQAVLLGAVKRFKCFLWMYQSGPTVADFENNESISTLRTNDQPLRVAVRILYRFRAVAN